MEPGAGETPIAHHRFRRNSQYLGGLLDAQSAKEAQFDDTSFAGINFSQRVEGIIKCHELFRTTASQIRELVEIHPLGAAASFGRQSAACPVQQNMPHDLGGDCEEMGTVLPINILDVDQLQVGLVDQGGCLQGVPGALVPQLVPGDALQGAIDARRQLLKSVSVASRPGAQKLRSF